MADERNDERTDIENDPDFEVTEVRETTEIVTETGLAPGGALPVEPGMPLAADPAVVTPGVVSEVEQVEVLPDGSVERRLDRVEQPATAQRRGGAGLGPALLVILLLALAAIGAAWYFSRDTESDVPSVVGLSLDQAVQRLQDEGFKSDISSQPNEEDEGVVFEQRPSSGTSADEGSTVLVLVSKGPQTVAVPNVVGVTEVEARDRLAGAGFVVSAVKVFSDEPENSVIAQNPAAGSQASKGSTARINVSKGTGLVDVPNVTGQQRAAAETTLAQAGLKANVVSVPAEDPAGTVVAQNPVGGQLRQGTAVRLNVSAGP